MELESKPFKRIVRSFFIFCSLVFAFTAQAAFDPAATATKLNDLGFECKDFDSSYGLLCFGKTSFYPREIAILVPHYFEATPSAEISLFLHGHNYGPESTLSQIIFRFSYPTHSAWTKLNAVFVFPHSVNKCDEFKSEIAPSQKFGLFLESVAGLIQSAGLSETSTVGKVYLSGHSGAYAPIATILNHGVYGEHLDRVILLDAMYGNADIFTRYAADPSHRFYSCYLPNASTRTQNEAVMTKLDQLGISYLKRTADMTVEEVQANRLGFVEANTTHGGTIKYLPFFLHP